MNCALCGRRMASPAVQIGNLPVGPKCARKAGLIEPARRRVGLLRLVGVRPQRVEDGQMELGLEAA